MSGNTSATGGYLLPTSPLPVNDVSLDAIMHDLIVGITGLPNNLVFPRWQPQPPTMPPMTTDWGSIGITGYEPDGFWAQMLHFDGYSVLRHHQKMNCLATFYGPNSTSNASLFRAGLLVPQNVEAIAVFGIKVHHIGNIMHAPELINTQYISRTDVEVILAREIDRTYSILNVNSATVIINEDGSTSTAQINPPS